MKIEAERTAEPLDEIPSLPASEILRELRQAPITTFQIRCIVVGICLNMLDGFDVLVMAFTSPGVAAEWHLTGSQLGVLLSIGLMGMAAGSLFLAPLADRCGRRSVIIVSIAICTIGMLLSAWTTNPYELAALRGLTGLGIGTVLPTVNVLISEYAPERWRNTCIVLYTAGYPIGATIGGGIAAMLIGHWGWPSAFTFGGLCSAILLPIVIKALPDSIEYLITKRPAGALNKVNKLLAQLRQPMIDAMPAVEVVAGDGRGTSHRLFRADNLRKLALICSAFFMAMGTLYFVNSWTPKLLNAQGMAVNKAIAGGVLFNLGGIIGTVGIGVLCIHYDVRRLTTIFAVITGVALLCIAHFISSYPAVLVFVTLVGASINGTIGGLYATATSLFATATRGTGMGWALGVGRLGAIVSPLLVGTLVDLHWSSPHLFQLSLVPMSLALLSFSGLRRRDLLV
jgi:benzoate transport